MKKRLTVSLNDAVPAEALILKYLSKTYPDKMEVKAIKAALFKFACLELTGVDIDNIEPSNETPSVSSKPNKERLKKKVEVKEPDTAPAPIDQNPKTEPANHEEEAESNSSIPPPGQRFGMDFGL